MTCVLGTWNQTITVYSRYIDKQARSVLWSRRVLHNCFVGKKIVRDLNNHDMIQSEEFVVRIPESEDYRESSDIDMMRETDLFTLSPGNVIFIGDTDFEIDEQTDGMRMSDLRNDHKDKCFEIRRFSDNTKIGFLKHYRVEG